MPLLDAIIVIMQYPCDQAVASARDQALARVLPYGSRRTHIGVWSRRRTVSSCRITILRLSDNYITSV